MFRMRRFRIFLVITILAILSLYEFSRLKSWNVPSLESLKKLGFQNDQVNGAKAKPNYLPPTDYSPQTDFEQTKPQEQSDPVEPLSSSAAAAPVKTSTSASSEPDPTNVITGEELLNKQSTFENEFQQEGQGRFDVKNPPSGRPKAYWKQQKEHFPVEKHITLPGEVTKPLPKIQYSFGTETSWTKTDRERKQTAIREAFKHAWSGYKQHAMGHDELRPITNTSADTFNGWGATLVDSLDTLWIMGLYDEFKEAVKEVEKIDFKTSPRKDIPLFETTIRYLGGLVAAYDISGANYTVLLDKAVELADILMGAFDTPNRMPMPYYQWAPSYASQPHRASTHIVMAELGSLAVEFTRLSQITKEPKYYDAIARVTNALAKWQMKTSFPGVWPVTLDASGCKKPEVAQLQDLAGVLVDGDDEITDEDADSGNLVKRQLDDFSTTSSESSDTAGKADHVDRRASRICQHTRA